MGITTSQSALRFMLVWASAFGSLTTMAADVSPHESNSKNGHHVEYIVTEVSPGTTSGGFAMNQAGAVTGVSSERAFLYSHGALIDLGTLGGPFSFGQDINGRRDVAGYSAVFPDDFSTIHAFLYRHGFMKDLGTLGGSRSFAQAINNAGKVVGYSELADGSVRAFLYSRGVMHDLGSLGGMSSWAYGINDKGEVTGSAQLAINEGPHAFVYSNGLMVDLGSLGGRMSEGRAINNRGQITGWSYPPGNDAFHRAFLYSDGEMENLLDARESDGSGINDHGDVVGSACDPAPVGCRAFLYSDGKTIDLNTVLDPVTGLGWRLSEARDINNAGWILANGFNDSLSRSGVLILRPIGVPCARYRDDARDHSWRRGGD